MVRHSTLQKTGKGGKKAGSHRSPNHSTIRSTTVRVIASSLPQSLHLRPVGSNLHFKRAPIKAPRRRLRDKLLTAAAVPPPGRLEAAADCKSLNRMGMQWLEQKELQRGREISLLVTKYRAPSGNGQDLTLSRKISKHKLSGAPEGTKEIAWSQKARQRIATGESLLRKGSTKVTKKCALKIWRTYRQSSSILQVSIRTSESIA